MGKTIFTRLAEINHAYTERIREANDLGLDETVAEIADEHHQFLCDASREMLNRAAEIEKIVLQQTGTCRDLGLKIVKQCRDYAVRFKEIYKRLETLQKQGEYPTNIPNNIFSE